MWFCFMNSYLSLLPQGLVVTSEALLLLIYSGTVGKVLLLLPFPSLFLNPSLTTWATGNTTVSSPITSPHCTWPPSPSSLQPEDNYRGTVPVGQPSSHSCIPPLQKSLKSKNFYCIFKPTCAWRHVSYCLRVRLLAHGWLRLLCLRYIWDRAETPVFSL